MSKKAASLKNQINLSIMFKECEKRNQQAKKNAIIKREVEESTTNELESQLPSVKVERPSFSAVNKSFNTNSGSEKTKRRKSKSLKKEKGQMSIDDFFKKKEKQIQPKKKGFRQQKLDFYWKKEQQE